MALAITNKANNVSTSNGFSTGSLSWTADTRGIVCVASAASGGGAPAISGHSVSGGGVTWNSIGSVAYGSRRRIEIFLSDDTPSTDALTITATVTGGSAIYNESQWSVEELAGADEITPTEAAQTASTGVGTSLATPSLGTLDAGDLAFAAAAFEDGADSFAWQAGVTGVTYRSGGGNVRSLRTGYSSSDETPGVSWTTSGNGCGIVGFIINAAAGGGGSFQAAWARNSNVVIL